MNMGNASHNQVEIAIENLSTSSESPKSRLEEKGECRICHDEEFVSRLEAPCSCNGSLKFVHRKCLSHWCNIKRNIICEICKQVYSPNYSVTEPPPNDDDNAISERLAIPETNIRMMSPLQRGINRLVRPGNSNFTLRNPIIGVIFGTLLLAFFVLMVIRDVYESTPRKEDKFSPIMHIAFVIITLAICILSWIFRCRA